MSKNYVWYSTQESRENHTTSILAIIETIFFVILTWGIAYYFDTYVHIYTAIAIAPFLLLKTPESTEKAIEWFLHEYQIDEKNYYKDKIFWLILLISVLLSFILSYFFVTKILIHYEGWELFFLSMLLGIILVVVAVAVAVVVVVGGGEGVVGVLVLVTVLVAVLVAVVVAVVAAVAVAAAGVVVGVGVGVIVEVDKIQNKILKNFILLLVSPSLLILGAGLGLGLFLRSLFIKFTTTSFYTLTHPKKTFFAISKNWNEQITINDILYTPELLPNIHERDSTYQLSSFVSDFKFDNLEEKIIKLLIIPIWSLGYLYRFSIKSTAWFFFPLAYLANLTALEDESKKEKAIKTQTWDKLFWFNLIVAAVLLLYFRFTEQYLKLLKLSEEQLAFISTQMTKLREYFVPEAMWLLVVAVILYFIMNAFISRKEHIKDEDYGLFSFWIIRLIYSLWMVFLGWHIVVFTNQYVLPELPKIFGMP